MYPLYILIFVAALVAILLLNYLSDGSDIYYIVPTRTLRMHVGSGKLLPSNTSIKRYITDNYNGRDNLLKNEIVITNMEDTGDGYFVITFYLKSDLPEIENFTPDLIEGVDNPNEMTPNQWCDEDALEASINSEFPDLLISDGSAIQCNTTFFKSSHLSTCGIPQRDGYGRLYGILQSEEYDKSFVGWELSDAVNDMKENNPQLDMCGNSSTEDPNLFSPSETGPIIQRCGVGGGDATWEGCYKNCNTLYPRQLPLVQNGGIQNIHDIDSDNPEINKNIIGNPSSVDTPPDQPQCSLPNKSCIPTPCKENYFKDDNHLLYNTCFENNEDGVSQLEVFLSDPTSGESVPHLSSVCVQGSLLPQKIIDNPRAYRILKGGEPLPPLNDQTRINHFREDEYVINCNDGYSSERGSMSFDRCLSGRNCHMSGTCSPLCNKPSDEEIGNYENTYLWESAPTSIPQYNVEYNNELLCSGDIDAEPGERETAKLYCNSNQEGGSATYVATGCFPNHCKAIQERDGSSISSSCIHRSAILNINTNTLNIDNMKICNGVEHDRILLGNSSPANPPSEDGISTGDDDLYGCSEGGFTELYNTLSRSIKEMGQMGDREDVHVNISRIQPLNTENNVTGVYVEYVMFCEGEECPKFHHEEPVVAEIRSPTTVGISMPPLTRPPPGGGGG
jgi:hypothetical protein